MMEEQPAAELYWPRSITIDGSGNLYISDTHNHCVRKVNSSGIITTIAGTPQTHGFSGDGGAATAAELYSPAGLTFDGSGNLYIADQANNCIRKVNTSGIISTVAGNNAMGYGFSGDGGSPTSAELSFPTSVTIDASGNMYITDFYNDRIRKVH